ncbi:MAG: peptidase M35 [Burkholderiales bacterium]|nr:peptidase M35 [Burkholderiales bacterium]
MKLSNKLKLSASILAALASFAASAGNNGITVNIAPAKNVLQSHDDVVVNVTLTNTSNTSQYVLKYYTPFNGIEESIFNVTRDGVKVPYLGAHYKRGTPKSSDYFELKPGKSYSQKVELSALYDMSVSGDYKISYKAASYNLFSSTFSPAGFASTEKELGAIQSDETSMFINGRHPRGFVTEVAQAIAAQPLAGSLSYTNCSASQQSTIATAVSNAKTYAAGANSYLGAAKTGPRYVTWFGQYDSTRYSNVKTHYLNIADAYANKAVTVDCGCKKSYYAYVYPTQPYKIYVCNAFWTAPMTGTDSKAGTLIHEMSHFNVVAATDDWVYGQSGAKSLAISNPSQATDNADSHEYFAENTPAQN